MPQVILHAPSSYKTSAKHYLIFFITGNPGLIAYYAVFLATLNDLLKSSHTADPSNQLFHIYGQSLAGFEDEDSVNKARLGPYSLDTEIELTFEALKAQRISKGERRGKPFDGIILMGHSVGSYMLLEILRRSSQEASPTALKVSAGILLFPTVTHISQSPSGIKIGILFRIPNFAQMAGILARGLFWPFSETALRRLVAFVTGMPEDAAQVTSGFLISKKGVWQALHLARDEMKYITEDRWDEDIWGVENPNPDSKATSLKLIFYFGQKDHWVADHTRDALIAARAKNDGDAGTKPTMLIDKQGIPHGFCIRHGELVAAKVFVWIRDIMDRG